MASSSSSRQSNYQIFLSFRGGDTRKRFTAFLLDALKKKGFSVFFDEEKLEMGVELKPALLEAIKVSKLSIIVLSEDYASSNSCLIELSEIMERKLPVVPVFYRVDPGHVRVIAGGIFEASFEDHRQKRPAEEVKKWEVAFTSVGHLVGCHIEGGNFDRPETKYIDEKIVPAVMEKLNLMASYESKEFVGIDRQKEKIKSLLCSGGEDIRIIGIWGMGGMGKTTLADAVYNEVRGEFQSCCFLENVREESEKTAGGIMSLRDRLLSELLDEKNLHIGTPSVASTVTKDRLRQKRVVVVLDDVHNSNQLKTLLMSRDDYGSGSRIIVTSRDRQVLINEVDSKYIYEIKGLEDNDSLRLFSLHAFKQNVPLSRFENQSKTIVEYVKGNPLALTVLGRALFQREEDYWQSQLDTLKGVPIQDIDALLRISFNGLGDDEKNIFLDIACFFKGFDKEDVTKILDGCYQGALRGITHLEDKTLLTIARGNKLWMHDLIQVMGWNIVIRSNPNIGERSRVWGSDDGRKVLKHQRENEAIQGIFLDVSQIRKMQLSPTVFTRMPNLRFLSFYNSPFSPNGECRLSLQSLESFPDDLRYLSWEYYPLKSFPSDFSPEYLVELRLPDSSIEQIWEGIKTLENLRVLDLKRCKKLTEIPDLSEAKRLKRLCLDGCESLVELPSMTHLESLEPNLHFNVCSNLKKFPQVPLHLKSLKLCNTVIEEVPESIKFLDQLLHLDLSGSMIQTLPDSIVELKSLRELNLSGCLKLVEFPASIKQLPSTLTSLYLQGCKSLKSIPVLPQRLIELNIYDCPSMKSVSGAQEFQYIPDGGIFHIHLMRFGNCFNLDADAVENIVANTLLKVHRMANTWANKKQENEFVEVIVAGSEISERFKYRSTNSSITHVKLLNPDWQGVRFLGFVPCVVIDCDECDVEIIRIVCRFELKTKGGEYHQFKSTWEYYRVGAQDPESFKADHAFIWFDSSMLQEDRNYAEASFKFYFTGHFNNGQLERFKVKKCGVHIFYANAERIVMDTEGESSQSFRMNEYGEEANH